MCRFLIATGNIDSKKFEKALEMMKRGGPDSTNIIEDKIDGVKVLMGHNRLSIIDLDKRSDQPFRHGKYRLLFNGELYNFKELRDSGDYGPAESYKTTGDTEVLARVLPKMLGDDPFNNVLNGEIALALVTPKRIIFHRDLSGVKPLYIAETKDGLIASSEIRPIAYLLGLEEVDHFKMENYLRYGFNSFGGTPFEEIKLLNPGEWVSYSIAGHDANVLQEKREDVLYVGKDQIFNALKESVRERVISDVPISLTLSGGLDSSIIAYLMKLAGATFHAYCLTMEGAEDEFPQAKKVADYLEIPITNIKVSVQDVIDNIDDIILRAEEPLDKGSLISTYFLAQAIQEKVTLIGEGADECFGGYNRHQSFFKEVYPARMVDILRRYYEVFNPEDFLIEPSQKIFEYPDIKQEDANFITAFDLMYEIPFYHTIRIDKMMMGFGIEARVPFLDQRITSIAEHIPAGLKISPEKRILREAFNGKMPEWMLSEKKKALKIPYAEYVNHPEVKKVIMENKAGIITKDAIIRKYGDLFMGEGRNAGRALWLIYLLNKVKESYEKKRE